MQRVAAAAQRGGDKAFVYIAGTECISKNADGPHTLAKVHPDWLQKKITGQPAIFASDSAFWIARVGSRSCLFFANFDGLTPGQNETPAPQHDLRITAPLQFGRKLRLLPFLGSETTLPGSVSSGRIEFTIPTLERGAVACFE